MGLYNSSELESADPLTIGILFGFSEGIGVALGGRFLYLFGDYKAMMIGTPLFLLLSTVLKVPGLSVGAVYVIFCL